MTSWTGCGLYRAGGAVPTLKFYQLMRQAKGVPSTAAITPLQFCDKYCQYVDEASPMRDPYPHQPLRQLYLRQRRYGAEPAAGRTPEHHLNIHLLDPHTYSMVFGWYICEIATSCATAPRSAM